MDQKGSIMK